MLMTIGAAKIFSLSYLLSRFGFLIYRMEPLFFIMLGLVQQLSVTVLGHVGRAFTPKTLYIHHFLTLYLHLMGLLLLYEWQQCTSIIDSRDSSIIL